MCRPSVQISAEFLHAGGERLSPIRGRHLPHRGSQPPLRFRRQQDGCLPALRGLPALKAEPEKVHLVRLAYPAFLLVHLEPHAPLKEMTDRSHDALSGPRAAHEDVAIVGVTNEPMTPAAPVPSPARRARCWTATATAGLLAVFPR